MSEARTPQATPAATAPAAAGDAGRWQQALRHIERLEERLRAAEAGGGRGAREPIAIVGLGCRFPGGADGPDAFWRLLREGRDGIGEMPAGRWDADAYFHPAPGTPGKTYTRHGGFLERVDAFEPSFFGLSQREAELMDPQHRLLLEVAWETLEHGGQAPDRLRGSDTGVFLGIGQTDYAQLLMASRDLAAAGPYAGTGNGHSFAAGRLSYFLGLQGPSFAVDTACSSSLVAVHLACESLRAGECSAALAGGIQLILSPEVTLFLASVQVLSRDGRCRSFEAAADGFGRGEGCGMVWLKRLADARRDGDEIWAVIRGSAINHDGPASGITVPNGLAQAALVRRALAAAGATPAEVDYVEAHGTGTPLGDPIEAEALGEVFAAGRDPARPLVVGAVKANLGHLEAAAGVAGLIKVALALRHGEVPPQPGFGEPSPRIPWHQLPLAVPRQAVPWRAARQRLAGVSSFGMSGANAHVVLGDPPPQAVPAAAADSRPHHLLALSARDEAALRETAARWSARLRSAPELPLADVAYTAHVGRARFAHRLAATGADAAALADALAALAAGRQAPAVRSGVAATRPPRVAFLFTGQGSQYLGMGRQLDATSAVFRQALDRHAAVLDPLLGVPLRDLLFAPGDGTADATSRLDETAVTQPALMALELALVELWASWGVTPVAVLGHSLGELVAATVAGVFDPADGLRLAAERGRLLQATPRGAMAAVTASAAELAGHLAAAGDDLAVAALNGPRETVVSGPADAVDALLAALARDGVGARRLSVSHAFHSPLVEPAIAAFEAAVAAVPRRPPRLPVVSNLDGAVADGIDRPAHWGRHLRETVRFADGLRTLASQADVLLEIGPQPVLATLGRNVLVESDGPRWAASLRRGRGDWETLLAALGELWVAGVRVDWEGFHRGDPRRRRALPTYPFQRHRCWFDAAPAAATTAAATTAAATTTGAALGPILRSPFLGGSLATGRVDLATYPDLDDHRVWGTVVVPGAFHLASVLAVAARESGGAGATLAEIGFPRALTLGDETSRQLQVLLRDPAAGEERRSFEVVSGDDDDGDDHWIAHATGALLPASVAGPTTDLDRAAIRERCRQEIAGDVLYDLLRGHHLELGPRFRWLETVWRREGEALARLRPPPGLGRRGEHPLPPSLLDACFQLVAATVEPEEGDTFAPWAIARLDLHRPWTASDDALWCHVRRRSSGGDRDRLVADLELHDGDGRPLVSLAGYESRRATERALLGGEREEPLRDWLYRVEWRAEEPLPASAPPAAVVAAVTATVEATLARHLDFDFAAAVAALDAASGAYVAAHVGRASGGLSPGERFTEDELAARIDLAAAHRRQLGRLLEMLAEDGFLVRRDGGWEAVRELAADLPEPLEAMARLVRQSPPGAVEPALLSRCGARLGELLRGEVDALELLFGAGPNAGTSDGPSAAELYRDSPGSRALNELTAAAVAAAIAPLPSDRELRVVEAGAGTGGTTTAVLPVLAGRPFRYDFTDLAPQLLGWAEERFGARPELRFRRLDLERPPAAQGFAEGDYDLAIAANVLHATADLAAAAGHLRRLLRPGGTLVLLESTAPQRFIDLLFGFTDGWWRGRDRDLRPDHPLIDVATWRRALAAAGFDEVAAVDAEPGSAGLLARQAVIVARVGAATETAMTEIAGRRWQLVGAPGGVAEELARRLRATGARCAVDPPAATAGLDIAGVDELVLLDESRVAAGDDVAEAVRRSTVAALAAVRAATAAAPPPRLWLVTVGAQPAAGVATTGLPATALWGMGKTIALEHPELRCRRVDLEPGLATADAAAALLAELARGAGAGDREDEIALRDAGDAARRHRPRLVRAALAVAGRPPVRADGTYLVTGGLGGLGLLVAERLAAAGAGHLVLIGRGGARGADAERFDRLAASGAQVHEERADVADGERLAAILARVRDELPPLRGVVHSAGVLADGVLLQQDAERFDRVLRPKVDGAWHLHRLTAEDPLDFFVLFSSAAAVMGAPGQANHAAANAFLDGLASFRRDRGLPATAIAWGAWDEVGAAARRGAGEALGLTGIGTLSPAAGLAIFDAATAELATLGDPRLAALPVDWRRFAERFAVGQEPPAVAALVAESRRRWSSATSRAASRPAGSARREETPWLDRLAAASPGERRALLERWAGELAAAVLRLPPGELDLERPLAEHGLDSLMAVEMRNRTRADLGVELPLASLLEGATLAGVLQAVEAGLAGPTPPREPEPTATARSATPGPEALAADEAARLLAELDGLSDEEVAELLELTGGEVAP